MSRPLVHNAREAIHLASDAVVHGGDYTGRVLRTAAGRGFLAATGMPGLRHSAWDGLLVVLALVHGALLLFYPTSWLIGLGFWWNSNTISHNFVHLPFFRSRACNKIFSAYLTLVLGIPQTFWRDRHLAHHANVAWKLRLSSQLLIESLLVVALWSAMLAVAPRFFFVTYLPGCLLGLGLCYLQGHYEHVRGTISHYGLLYNLLFFNDGYHVEHHARPATHWTRLPDRRFADAQTSRWPAVFRWLEMLGLDFLERLVLRSARLQRFVLKTHERAFRRLLSRLPAIQKVEIVGGGMFPRTGIVLRRLLPQAQIRIIDASAENLATAKQFLNGDVEFAHEFFDASRNRQTSEPPDLLVIPLAFIGDRREIYQQPPAPHVLVHDWLWRRRRRISTIISLLLLKRLNLVMR